MAISSAGSMIGAILESAGYHYQALILNALSDPLTNEVGGLVYLVGIMIAVSVAATQGKFTMSVWLLVGPPIFFAVIQPRDTMQNARWDFALEGRAVEQVNKEVQKIVAADTAGAGGGDANVSVVFKRYVEMMSATTKEIVSIISKNRSKGDIWFIVRAQLYALMHTGRVTDPGLSRLLHYSLLGECQTLVDDARAIDDSIHRERLNAARGEIDQVDDAVESKEYQEVERKAAQTRFNENVVKRNVNLDALAARYVLNLEGNTPTIDEVNERAETPVSCQEIWGWVLDGLKKYSSAQIQKILEAGQERGISVGKMANLMAQVSGSGGSGPVSYDESSEDAANLTSVEVGNLVRVVAKYYLRNEYSNRDKSAYIAQFVTRLDSRDIRTRSQGRNSFTEMARVSAMEWGEKDRMMYAAGSLPYYQGLLLYFLGATFPFFALVLLVPGKQAGFLLWFMLWMWVKSWDIGLAIVMLVDDLLFAMLATQVSTIGKTEGTAANDELTFAFATLSEMDPTFQLTTYYTIMATAILAIPVVSAQLVLGGIKGGASIVADGASKSASFFGEGVTRGVEQGAISDLRQQARDLKMQRAAQFQSRMNSGQPLVSNNELGSTASSSNNIVTAGDGKDPVKADAASVEDRKNKAQQAGTAKGLSLDPTYGGNHPLVRALVQAYTAKGRNVTATDVKEAFAKVKQERLTAAAHADWLTDIDQRSYEIYERIAIMRAIPIPWTNFSQESSESEFNLAISRYEYEEEMNKAEIDANREMFEAFTSIATEVITEAKGKGKVPLVNGHQIDFSKLDSATRQEIGNRYKMYLTNSNRALGVIRAGAVTSGFAHTAWRSTGFKPVQQFSDQAIDAVYGERREFGGSSLIDPRNLAK